MRVAIIGAGMAGLACARRLREAGVSSVLWEKSRGPGGRCATRRREGFTWDTGSTSILPRGHALERVMLDELSTEGLVRLDKPVFLVEHGRIVPGDPKRGGARYVYTDGINTLARRLAEGLEVRVERTVEQIKRDGERFWVEGEPFDAVVITLPTPQASLLLWSLDESRPLANVRYRPCLTISLGYREPLPDTPYFALLEPRQQHPVTWVSLESVKVPARKPAVVVQINREWSRRQWGMDDTALVRWTLPFLSRFWGPHLAEPVATDVMRWKYSQPEALALFDEVNPPGTRLLIAGDALRGGHLETAYDAGLEAANRLLA